MGAASTIDDMRSRRLELVVLRFNDVTADAARSFVARTETTGHLHVVTAVVAHHETDGSVVVDEWAQPADLPDLVVDLAAHRQFDPSRDRVAYLARTRPPNTTVLILLVEHRCASAFATDLDARGGVLPSSAELRDELIGDVERDVDG